MSNVEVKFDESMELHLTHAEKHAITEYSERWEISFAEAVDFIVRDSIELWFRTLEPNDRFVNRRKL